MGAGKIDRIKQGFKAGVRLVWVLTVPLFLLYFFAGKPLMGIFLNNPSAEAMNSGLIFLKIVAPFYFFVSAKIVADGILRGVGRMTPFMISTFTDLVLRVGLANILSATALGSTGIWCSWPIGWVLGCGISMTFYFTTPWMRTAMPELTEDSLKGK